MPLTTATEEPFKNMLRQMNKPKDPTQKGYFNFLPTEVWTPSVNLYETAGAYLVCVDLAGVEKEKIDVVVEGQQLRLRGARPVPNHAESPDPQSQRVRVHLMEIDHGGFSREVELPQDVIREQIKATYRNGMLWIELPKKRT